MSAAGQDVKWVLARAKPGDVSGLARLHAGAFTRGWTEAELSDLLTSPGVAGIAATTEGAAQPSGFILTRVAGDEAEIITLAVDKDRRRCGCATALLAAAMEAMRAQAVASVFLEVASDNEAAIALYSRFGFSQTGTRPGYYRRARCPSVDALVLRCTIATA